MWACTVAEIITFSLVGSIIYVYTGSQYVTAPAFGGLQDTFKKVSYSFMVPTIIFVGCLYASVSSRFIFFRMFKNTKHVTEHTIKGWAWWSGVLLLTWIASFIIAEVIPFFSSCKWLCEPSLPQLSYHCTTSWFATLTLRAIVLSVMSSLFNCWFGFIFWAVAYFRMRNADIRSGTSRSGITDILGVGLNAIIILIGAMYLTLGTYVSVQGIIDQFRAGTVAGVFSCAPNGL